MSDSDESDNESLNGSDSDTSVDNTPITKKININPLNNNLGEDDLDDDELPDDDEEEVVEEEDEVEEILPKTKNRVGYGFDNDVNAESDYEEDE